MKILNVDTTKINNTKEARDIDNLINVETERRIKAVKGAEHYGIMTACFIDGEFVLCSDYEVSEEIYEQLKKA